MSSVKDRMKQKKISSFFSKPKSDPAEHETGGASVEKVADDRPTDMDMDIDEDEPEEEEEEEEGGTTGKKDKFVSPEDSSLPPISRLHDIFLDIVSRLPEAKTLAEHIKGRKLRVATMCSGTESPLLALNLISRSMTEKFGTTIEVEHVFSCEIVPFKQAYIERNFQPPLLFRDVCELGDDYAHTAYGAKAFVPGNVDILIAGTSCVDYSNLNNEKKDIDQGGESGRTFHGMLNWIKKHRPPIVILENVCSAPWQTVVKKFEDVKYSAKSIRMDTKAYYVPHTRTRGYMMAVNAQSSSIPSKWADRMTSMKREASSTLDAFLLPSDDPRIHQARERLVQESYNALDRKTGRTDWGRCESRHQRTRLVETLGSKRPLTNWDEGGSVKMLDYGWADWASGQVERVWDLMDISLLRSAVLGVDPSYKSQVWNLSQNVDRSIGSNRVGISPCLTPSMIPYITNRGGPMVGLEALHLQGLPIDELLLTRETEDQLADLAGNAMSTTVVGTSVLVSLILSMKHLTPGHDKRTYEERHGTHITEKDEDVMEVEFPPDSVQDHIVGEDQLMERPFDLSRATGQPLHSLLDDAMKSVRFCTCEGRKDMTEREVRRCDDCGFTACVKCGGRPEHNSRQIDVKACPRLAPSVFERSLKSALPMCLALSGITEQLLDSLKQKYGTSISSELWEIWRSAVIEAVGLELRFVELKRQELWHATYESSRALMELCLHPKRPEWLLYAKPSPSEPANAEIRKLLMNPVARLACDGSLLNGRWEIALPQTTSVEISVQGAGERVASWQSKLGLQDPKFLDGTVFSQLEVSVPRDDVVHFDRDISGTYLLLDKCGTANNALHKKISPEDDAALPPLFLLLDPTRSGKPSDDSFVFSTNIRRLEYQERRTVLARLQSSWRQSSKEGPQRVSCVIPQKYVFSDGVSLNPSYIQGAHYSVPQDNLCIQVSKDACKSANALLVARVPLHSQAGPEWPKGTWTEVEQIYERATFRALSWLLERIKVVDGSFTTWQEVELPEDHSNCERCAPLSPSLRWIKQGKKVMAIEDSAEAGEYERRLKRRPAPFVTQLKLDDNGTGTVRIGVNIASLTHRALARLPTVGREGNPALSWRLDPNFKPLVKLILPKFHLHSNRSDPQHHQPPHFEKFPLRIEQLRSLHWMLEQENPDAPPFIEEEVSEAILEPLGWRAEGRAQQPVHIRGGVLADQVGYGKTAITLGLIDCTRKEVARELENAADIPGKIRVKASLVVVPPHLTRQWSTEIKKFVSSKAKLEVVTLTIASNLNTLTIEKVINADIIVVASNLFKSTAYIANLEAIAAGGSLPASDGRYFNARLDIALDTLKEQVDRLREEGSVSVMDAIHAARKKDEEAENALRPSKRIRGIQETTETHSAPKSKASSKSGTSSGRLVFSHVEVPLFKDIQKQEGKRVETIEILSTRGNDVQSDGGEEQPIRRLSRKVSKMAVHTIDSDSEEERPAKTVRGSKKKTKRRSESPEFVVSDSDEDKDGPDDSPEVSDDDSDAPKAKSRVRTKAKSKASAKPKKKSRKSESEDIMDVDEAVSTSETSSNKSKKRKRVEKEEKPKELREAKDPWKLRGAAKRDWKQMQCPPLEMFHFARKVVDEYTYLDGKIHTMVTRLSADRHWVLSGTPPIHDFAAVKTIAAHLNLHLGIDDDNEGKSIEVKKRRREQTAVEKFHSFRETHSLDWHAHRHELGQKFLDCFVRQNIAEIDEIPWEEKIEKISLPAAERAIYLELEHHLRALDMTIKRGKKTDGDREKRVAQSLGDSNTAEEALLKRCSHFELETSNKENAMEACEVIVKERKTQLEDCRNDLLKKLKEALAKEKEIGKPQDDEPKESMFREYVRVCRAEGVGDDEGTKLVAELLKTAGVGDHRPSNAGHNMKDSQRKETIWEHREQTHMIRKLTKELVGRVRSLRYFTIVRDLQKQSSEPPVVSCPECGRERIPLEEIAVLSSCGHAGCFNDVKPAAEGETCVYARSGRCKAAARVLNIVKGDTLGVDDYDRDGKGKHFGMKLEKVIHLIRKRIPSEERVLIFVQFPDLMKKVAEALNANKVRFLEIKGSAAQKSKNLEKFQTDGEERVLLLNVMDESASGANLTSANHAIFLSPLLAPTQEIYQANETQAIGRLRRYGQAKKVYIWRFLTKDTIDVDIYEARTGKRVE
ncbi:hypothetical protein B0F90DRAFT_1694134 [Multifurca ochricompacta]|uniref:Helicase C-terminal domain-containing protein n=1 Tax=Multifurca ochricompacta TaxID=376703 RepID=A0AAD4QPR0_9AGAM|nr:hypothetical protein B0F90DRAFT_1694134 [Multifurca ochricompacta]